MKHSILRLGCASADITPSRAIPLAGYFMRRGSSVGVAHRLMMRALVFEDINGSRALVISGDLIWWDSVLLESWKKQIECRYGINSDAQFFSATHTHSGPMPGFQLASTLGRARKWYIDKLEKTVYDLVGKALNDLEAVAGVRRGHANCAIGINRRKRDGDRIVTAPNPMGLTDPEVTVLQFRSKNRTKAVLCHFTCHPTVKSDLMVSSEYCGFAMNVLEKETDATAVFLQGCAGDIRPNRQSHGAFVGGSSLDVENIGSKFLGSVRQAMRNGKEQVFSGEIRVSRKDVKLPFQKGDHFPAPATSLQRKIRTKWQAAMLCRKKGTTFETLQLHLLSLGSEVSLLGFNGEMVVDYGLYVKKLTANQMLPVAYTNGMTGYIPTDRQIEEGGYEGGGAHKLFLLPGPFRRGVEKRVKKAISNMLAKKNMSKVLASSSHS